MLTILAPNQFISVGIPNDVFRFDIELDRAAGASDDVAKMRQRSGPMTFLDADARLLTSANAVKEVACVGLVNRGCPVRFLLDHGTVLVYHTIAPIVSTKPAELRHRLVAVHSHAIVATLQTIRIPQTLFVKQ